MPQPSRRRQAVMTPASRKPIEPQYPKLSAPPETLEALFRCTALSVSTHIDQPPPSGNGPARRQAYSLPWAGFHGWRDARSRLEEFEKAFKGQIDWRPFNDSESNDGPMSLNAYPGRAFIERVTNEGDANLEAMVLGHKGPMPQSPFLAVSTWFNLDGDALSTGLSDTELRDLARRTVTVTGFLGDSDDPKGSVFDARDYGVGLTAAEMPNTILSLNRGNKKNKSWLTGKHGQGASSTYQYSDLTLIASRKQSSPRVAFTFVEARWDNADGFTAKTPTYRYLTVAGNVPEIELAVSDFPAGTLVRHIGYYASELFNPLGEHSLYGLLMRSLAQPLFPVWLEIFSLKDAKAGKFPTFPGFRRYGRTIRGTVNVLNRAWHQTVKGLALSDVDEPPEDTLQVDPVIPAPIIHRTSEYYELPQWDYGGRSGVGELGKVKMTWWVAEPAGRSANDVVRNWVNPDKSILMTLDGQTHAEESRAIITGQQGAKLWAVGRYMVVQVDCDGLDPKAKYEMFTSTREHAKETPIKRMILEELVRRLGLDKRLQELNVRFAAADVKQTADAEDAFASMIKRYLKTAGVNFDQLTRRVEKWIDVEEEVDAPTKKRDRPEPPPIEAVEPPTFIRWRFAGPSVKLYPGQRYSYLFETDAGPAYWNPADQVNSAIKVLAHAVSYIGAGEMRGGRVRCHFECPAAAPIGSKGFIQVQLDFTLGAALTQRLPVEIVERPEQDKSKREDQQAVDPEGTSTKVIKVKVRKKDFTEVEIPVLKPVPVKPSDSAWTTLGWPHDPRWVGFSIRSVGGRIQLYYNATFPPFLDLRNRMSKKSLHDEFVRRYEVKLVIHTMFSLNYDFVDEEDFIEEQRKRVRNLLCATAESLALATKSEIEIESKLKSEDGVPLESAVAGNLAADSGDPGRDDTDSTMVA